MNKRFTGTVMAMGETKTCPTCQYKESRLDAPYCAYCGGKHTSIIIQEVGYSVKYVPSFQPIPGKTTAAMPTVGKVARYVDGAFVSIEKAD